MKRPKSRPLTEVELEFMQVLWSAEDWTTDQVQHALRERGRDLSDGSIRKVLAILKSKGFVTRRQAGRGFRYRAQVPKEEANRSMLHDLLKRAFGGSAAMMVATLLDGSTVRPKDLREIKRLIAERERRGQS